MIWYETAIFVHTNIILNHHKCQYEFTRKGDRGLDKNYTRQY